MQEQRFTADRIGAFSDGVMAILITLMVLELKAPVGRTVADLLPLWPTVISYAASYLFMAIIWINHHYLLHVVHHASLRLIWFNFLHLFAVSFLPFATAWIARTHLAATPVTIYAVLFLAIDLAYFAFEREVLAQARESLLSQRTRKVAAHRTFRALAFFGVAALLSPLTPLVGFGLICCALILYVRPEAVGRVRTEQSNWNPDGPPPF